MSFYKEVPGRQTTLESTLKFDTEPKAGSTNPVTSEGVKSAIDGAVGDAAVALQEQIDEIAEKAGSGYIPKGESSVATLNALSGQENGDLYTMTDAGTLTDGSLAVVAGDTVAWDATNEVWYKAMDYAPRQYGTNEVRNLPTSITAFRTGDVIPVDGPSGTAKMSKDDLLRVTAENALNSTNLKTELRIPVQSGCFYANDFGSRNTNSARAGSVILEGSIGQFIKINTIAGYKLAVTQSKTKSADVNNVDSGWLDSETAILLTYKYYAVVVKKDDGSTFTQDNLNEVSSTIVLTTYEVSNSVDDDGKLADNHAVQNAVQKLGDNQLPLNPYVEVGSINLSGNQSNDYRCRSVDIVTAATDLCITPAYDYKFWAVSYDSNDDITGWTFGGTEIHYGDTATIKKGTRYRLVIAHENEVPGIVKAVPDIFRKQVVFVSALKQEIDSVNLKTDKGYSLFLPELEVGSINASGTETVQNGRCRSVSIQTAIEDLFLSPAYGYKFWAMSYDSNDDVIGWTFGWGTEIHYGEIGRISAGTRYRIIMGKDPEVYAGANPLVYSKQILIHTDIDRRLHALEEEAGTLEIFSIYGKSSTRCRTETIRIREFTPYTIGCQSIAVDRQNREFYRLCGEGRTDVDVYGINGSLLRTITTKGSSGHDNDSCYVNGIIYIAGSSESVNHLYKWDVVNGGCTEIDTSAITDNPNGSHRGLFGVCQKDATTLYLVCRDYTPNDELNPTVGDLLTFYEMNMSTETIQYKGSLPWDCVYVQGCTSYCGMLYVACNTMTTGTPSNYKGVTLKIIDTDDWKLVDEIIFDGVFEPEGLDYFAVDNEARLITCFMNNGYRADVCTFIPNW